MLLAVTSIGASIGAQERPLPEAKAFAREVRARVRPDREVLSQYTYIERREEVKVSALGDVHKEAVKVYEVYPSLEPGNTYKRLISVNGVPLSAEELAKNERKHRADLAREREKRRRESPRERANRLAKQAKEEKEEEAFYDELLDAYDIRLVRREPVGEYTTVLATLEPRPTHLPRSDEGKIMKKVRARVWVSESDYQVVKVEAVVAEDITVGLGLVGRLHKGSKAIIERRKINDEVWLPGRELVTASGRTLLFRTFNVNAVTEYSDYRRIASTSGGLGDAALPSR
jgi:hypothetical protein